MEKNNALVPKQQFKGIVPVVKSFLFGSESGLSGGPEGIENSYTTQTFFQRITGAHSFNATGLKYLVETGYTNNPVGFGIIRKILLAQRNIVFTPYWKGKPYKSKIFNFDVNFALEMLITTGTCICYKQKIVGFPEELKVLNTLHIQEVYSAGNFRYKLNLLDGTRITLNYEDMIFVRFANITSKCPTNLGLCPFQAALMPIESLKYMYEADTATLKNKGVDVLITNDSEVPLVSDETVSLSEKLNKEISGARRAGSVATSTAKLRVLNLGRTTKELALWDGYKYKNRDLCTVLQVDSGQVNDPDNKKFANVEESNKALYNDCVIPFTRLITENKEILEFLGYDIFLDTSNIDCLQEAQATRFEKNNTITNTIINLNQQIKNGVISSDIAIHILVSEWGFDEQEAKQNIMVSVPVVATEQIPPSE